jgi:hypothetical protein
MIKINLHSLSAIIICSILMSSCGAIVGGSIYKARISTPTAPDAKIFMNNSLIGTGSAFTSIKRTHADKLDFTVKKEGCDDQTFSYRGRTFRGWAFVGTILGWTGVISGVPLPWGLVVDLASGSLWKPNVLEPGIQKIDYKNYQYILNYTGCQGNDGKNISKPKDNDFDQVFLINGSIIKGYISEEEPNKSLKITDSAGNLFVFKVEEIQKIVRGRR